MIELVERGGVLPIGPREPLRKSFVLVSVSCSFIWELRGAFAMCLSSTFTTSGISRPRTRMDGLNDGREREKENREVNPKIRSISDLGLCVIFAASSSSSTPRHYHLSASKSVTGFVAASRIWPGGYATARIGTGNIGRDTWIHDIGLRC